MANQRTRKLSDCIGPYGDLLEFHGGPADVSVTSVEYDSRKVKEGSLFVAVEGFSSDGHDYVAKAIAAGAIGVVVSSKRVNEYLSLEQKGVAVISSRDSRKALSAVAASFFDWPSRSMTVLGITGTNGKTSITYMLESILNHCGYSTGIIGTVNYRWAGNYQTAPNTTPESKDLQELLWKMKEDGVTAVVMEVSSHALKLNRADDLDFDSAVFTNLTRDHMDFHPDFNDYYGSKKRLFELLNNSMKEKKQGFINGDDQYGQKMLEGKQDFNYQIKSFGMSDDADFKASSQTVENKISGLKYDVHYSDNEKAIVELSLAGSFHVYNSLAAFAVAAGLGLDRNAILAGLKSLQTVPGRYDVVRSEDGFSVVVDYAHTSDALQKLLQSVKELEPERLITVFGCGGDRDKTKRPIMGQVAENYSDIVIVTSDNPRTEDPVSIIEDIKEGLTTEKYEIVPDRVEAIKKAITIGNAGDIIVIAGKGHEDYQILGTEKIHFDDKEYAETFIKERAAG